MEIKLCPNCHTKNSVDAWTCINCGLTLSINTVVDENNIDSEIPDEIELRSDILGEEAKSKNAKPKTNYSTPIPRDGIHELKVSNNQYPIKLEHNSWWMKPIFGKEHRRWVLYNGIGFVIALFIIPIIVFLEGDYHLIDLFFLVFDRDLSALLNLVSAVIILGLCMGVAQILALEIHLCVADRLIWIGACTIGLLFTYYSSVLSHEYHDDSGLVIMLGGGLGGLMIGFFQWRILRNYMRQSWYWIISNLFAGLIGFGVISWTSVISWMVDNSRFGLDKIFGKITVSNLALLGGIFGVIFGVISGMPIYLWQRVGQENVEQYPD